MVKDDHYTSVDDIRTAMEAVLTKDFMNHIYYHWVLVGDYPLYQNIDGKLHIAMLDAVNIPLLPEVKKVKKMSETEMVLLM